MAASFQGMLEPPKKSGKSRRRSLDIPAKFEDGDDAHDDAAAPKSGRGQYMNQSFISLIANVGTNAKFKSDASTSLAATGRHPRTQENERKHGEYIPISGRGSKDSKRRMSERNMLRSLPAFNKESLPRRQRTLLSDDMSASQILLPVPPARPISPLKSNHHQPGTVAPKNAPLQRSTEEESGDMNTANEDVSDPKSQTSLAERLQHIFGFENEEEVISG